MSHVKGRLTLDHIGNKKDIIVKINSTSEYRFEETRSNRTLLLHQKVLWKDAFRVLTSESDSPDEKA